MIQLYYSFTLSATDIQHVSTALHLVNSGLPLSPEFITTRNGGYALHTSKRHSYSSAKFLYASNPTCTGTYAQHADRDGVRHAKVSVYVHAVHS